MTYKIDKNLPWFEAKKILKDDMYVNIISETHSEELNPNGLFSGFLSGDVFFTSRWNGFVFEPLEIKKEDIDQVLFLEVLENQRPKDFRKDSVEGMSVEDYLKNKEYKREERSIEDIIKDSMAAARGKNARNSFYPDGKIPYESPEDAQADWEEMKRLVSKGSNTLFNSKDFSSVFNNWGSYFNTPNKK